MFASIVPFLASFIVTFIVTPLFIKKFRENKILARDMYKKGRPKVPTMGGLAILVGIVAGLICAQFFVQDVVKLLIFYFIVITFAIFMLIDDLIDVGRKLKIIVPFFLALPIALLNIDTSLSLYFFQIELGAFYSYVIAPLYLMVVANLINMHSGFNGLATGLSLILLIAIGIKAFMMHGISQLCYLMPVLGAGLAFFWFNKYPSRIFEGNVGSFTLGSAIGGLLILYNMEFFGGIILIPHIVNFLMYVYWRIKKYPLVKFGRIRKDRTLVVPNPLTLKWVFPYYFRLTEKQSILIMYILTVLFCIVGVVFF